MSRFITYPDVVTVDPEHHKILVVGATAHELVQMERFMSTSTLDFDVYLYKGDEHDLEWLSNISTHDNKVPLTLIKEGSVVSVTSATTYMGEDLLSHFEQIEKESLDHTVHSSV
jgi:hypothetical protein|tara:strand:+ start:1789 stop:2130 length:342 start_codon:yes stop_codon:yes gene_type:complete